MTEASYIFPWEVGKEHPYALQILIVWLTFGSIVNASQLFLHSASGQLRKQPICRIIIWLSSIDFAFDFLCLIQCSLNYHFKKFFGEELLCRAQAFWAEFFLTMSGFSIVCTLLASYMTIIHNRMLTTKEIDKLHLGATLYCLLLSFLGVIAPGDGTLNPPGLFCYTAAHRLIEALLFHIGFLLPLICTLVYLWYRIYRRVQDMTKFLAKRKLNIEARKGQVRMAKRMAWYIYFFLICYSPYEIALWYAWITGKHGPVELWITFSMLAHILTVANPILYFVLNQSARHIAYEHCRFCCRSQIDLRDAIRRSSLSGLNPSANKEVYQLEELTRALLDTEVLNQMLAYAEEKFCSEPIHFWIDVQVWKTMCSKIFTPQNTPAETPLTPDRDLSSSAHGLLGSPDGTVSARSSLIRYASQAKRGSIEMGNLILFSPPEEKASKVGTEKETKVEIEENTEEKEDTYRGDLEELREFGKSVYLTYFVRDGAPLELNIGDRNIARVVRDLKIRETKDGPVCRIEHTPKIIHLFDAAEHECLRLLYDNVYRPFCAKIQMDDVLKNQERLKNLHSGDVLPWKTDGDNDREGSKSPSRRSSRCGTPSRRGIDYTQVILPKGAGGVSTRKLKQGTERESLTEHSISRSNNSGLEVVTDSGSTPLGGTLKLFYAEQPGGIFSVEQHEQQQSQQSDSSSPISSIRSSSGSTITTPKFGESSLAATPSATPIFKPISFPSSNSTPSATPVLKSFDESEELPEDQTPRRKKQDDIQTTQPVIHEKLPSSLVQDDVYVV